MSKDVSETLDLDKSRKSHQSMYTIYDYVHKHADVIHYAGSHRYVPVLL